MNYQPQLVQDFFHQQKGAHLAVKLSHFLLRLDDVRSTPADTPRQPPSANLSFDGEVLYQSQQSFLGANNMLSKKDACGPRKTLSNNFVWLKVTCIRFNGYIYKNNEATNNHCSCTEVVASNWDICQQPYFNVDVWGCRNSLTAVIQL